MMYEFQKKLQDRERKGLTFDPIEVGDFRVSVQASALHNCKPNKTVEDITDYTHYEVRILDGDGAEYLNRYFIREFPTLFYFTDIHKYWKGTKGSYVPADVVQSIVDFLRHISTGNESKDP